MSPTETEKLEKRITLEFAIGGLLLAVVFGSLMFYAHNVEKPVAWLAAATLTFLSSVVSVGSFIQWMRR